MSTTARQHWTAIAHRDVYIDTVSAGVAHWQADLLLPRLHSLLEAILPFMERQDEVTSWNEASFDNYRFLVYELFLYTVASFLKNRKYEETRALLDFVYVSTATFGGTELRTDDFSTFCRGTRSLDGSCARKAQRISLSSDLLKERATRKDLRYQDILQADIILWLSSDDRSWYPQTLVFAGHGCSSDLFLRAVDEAGFKPLKTLLGIGSPKELVELIQSERIQRAFRSERLWIGHVTGEVFNERALVRAWGRGTT